MYKEDNKANKEGVSKILTVYRGGSIMKIAKEENDVKKENRSVRFCKIDEVR